MLLMGPQSWPGVMAACIHVLRGTGSSSQGHQQAMHGCLAEQLL